MKIYFLKLNFKLKSNQMSLEILRQGLSMLGMVKL